MQPLPMQLEMCLEIEEGELVTVDDCNNNSLDNPPFPISESSIISVHHTSNPEQAMENAMDPDHLLVYEPKQC